MADRDERPNVVVILSDDQATWALGCAGNPEILTPNLDRLAATGTRFDNFFCTSPVCSPARASLLTGRIPSQHGVHDWISRGNVGDDRVEFLAGQEAYTDVLARHGYDCAMIGKWHLGASDRPQKAFSHWFVHQGGVSSYQNAPMVRDRTAQQVPGYLTDVITDDALEYLRRRDADPTPFYLSIHHLAPHSPWVGEHPQDLVASYDDCPFDSCLQEPEHPWSLRSTTPAGVRSQPREHLKGYFAAVTAMDAAVGRVLDALERYRLRDNTLVCFLSDNGFNAGHHGIWGKGNGTYPQNMYDTSVRVPLIVSHPGRIPQGVVRDDLVSGYDFRPTLLDYVGVDPAEKLLPGRSFAGLLRSGDEERREQVVVYDEYGPVRMVRTRDWKYVHRYPQGPDELFDLQQDPGERVNLAADPRRAQVASDLRAQLEDWFDAYADPAADGRVHPVTGKGQRGPGRFEELS